MKTLVIFIGWLIIGLVGANSLQNNQFGLFVICAISFPILTIILFMRVCRAIIEAIALLIRPKKKYHEVKILDKEEIYKDSSVEHITLDHPDYIGLLTKIDKKQIAEEYMTEQKKKGKR